MNWAASTGKAGLRWDGYYVSLINDVLMHLLSAFVLNITPHPQPTTNRGIMLRNVIWNTSGVVVKGDFHNVTKNTVFDGCDIGPSIPMHDQPRYQDDKSFLASRTTGGIEIGAGTKTYNPKADERTVIDSNLVDQVLVKGAQCPTAPNCTLPGQYINNMVYTETYFDIRSELRDPFHHDFRPCPLSKTAKLGVGAYAVYSPSDTAYWIVSVYKMYVLSAPPRP